MEEAGKAKEPAPTPSPQTLPPSSNMPSAPPSSWPPVLRHKSPSKAKIVLSLVDEIKLDIAGKAIGLASLSSLSLSQTLPSSNMPSAPPTWSPVLSKKSTSKSKKTQEIVAGIIDDNVGVEKAGDAKGWASHSPSSQTLPSSKMPTAPPTRPPVLRHKGPSKSKIVLSIVDEIKVENAGKVKGPAPTSPSSSPQTLPSSNMPSAPPTRLTVKSKKSTSKSKIVLSLVDEIKLDKAGKAKGLTSLSSSSLPQALPLSKMPSAPPTRSPVMSKKSTSKSKKTQEIVSSQVNDDVRTEKAKNAKGTASHSPSSSSQILPSSKMPSAPPSSRPPIPSKKSKKNTSKSKTKQDIVSSQVVDDVGIEKAGNAKEPASPKTLSTKMSPALPRPPVVMSKEKISKSEKESEKSKKENKNESSPVVMSKGKISKSEKESKESEKKKKGSKKEKSGTLKT